MPNQWPSFLMPLTYTKIKKDFYYFFIEGVLIDPSLKTLGKYPI